MERSAGALPGGQAGAPAPTSDEFDAVTLAAKPRKRSTLIDYRATLRNHLRPAFGGDDLVRLSQQPERFERYAAEKLDAGRSPKSVRNDLNLAGLMFRQAKKWRWVSENPLDLVDPPPLEDGETETLTGPPVPGPARSAAGWGSAGISLGSRLRRPSWACRRSRSAPPKTRPWPDAFTHGWGSVSAIA